LNFILCPFIFKDLKKYFNVKIESMINHLDPPYKINFIFQETIATHTRTNIHTHTRTLTQTDTHAQTYTHTRTLTQIDTHTRAARMQILA